MNHEPIFTWFLGIIILLAFVIPYIYSIRKKETETKLRLKKTKLLGQDKPFVQHPIINRSVCIGCGICVDSCPEGDVLGLLYGRSTIIHGSHCVGHGQCAANCPVGAIGVGLGDISEREDIPLLTENYETNIPGIYIVGELSGFALIRNAIEHGVTAVGRIAQNMKSHSKEMYDIVIVGAGPAGLAAALKAKELKLNYIVIDQYEPGGTILHYPRRKLTLVQRVALPLYGELKKYEYSKEELLDIWTSLIKTHTLNLQTNCKLLNVTQPNGHFSARTTEGELKTKNVILALGRRGTPNKLNIPGEETSKVMYKLIDADTFKEQNIIVVGGGDSAIEAAIGLASQQGNQVLVSYRKANFFRLKARNETNLEKMMNEKRLSVLFNSNLKEIKTKDVNIDYSGETISKPNDFVFVFSGGEVPFPILHSLGIEFGKKIIPKA